MSMNNKESKRITEKKSIPIKTNVMPVIVLGAICLIVAALLGLVNSVTAPVIEEAESQKVYDSLREVIDGTFEPVDPLPEGVADTVTAMYKVTDGDALVGHAVTVSVKGYASQILITVGVDADGKITKAVVTSEAESHGKAGMDSYTDAYQGVGADAVADVELFSGATVSSTAIKGGIIDAVNAVTGSTVEAPAGGDEEEEEKPPFTTSTPIEDILSRAKALVGGSPELVDVTPESKPESMMKLYSVSTGGYVAYVATPGEYVPVANEGLVYINADGDIVAVDHFNWVVGNQISSEGFADKFVGEDLWSVGDVELITQATYTSGDFRAAVEAALDTVAKMTVRTDKKLLSLVDKIVPNSKGFEMLSIADGAPESLKRIYRETSGLGYVAYIVTSGWGGSIATESLVYFDTERTVKDVDILIWNVGHGIGYGDLDERLVGADADTIEDVELITAATGTSGDLRDAIAAAMPYIPKDFPLARALGIAILALSAVVSISLAVVIKIRRRKKG